MPDWLYTTIYSEDDSSDNDDRNDNHRTTLYPTTKLYTQSTNKPSFLADSPILFPESHTMSDTCDTKDQVAPDTPHKKNEDCPDTKVDIPPAALKYRCQKHTDEDSLSDSQAHPKAAKETEDVKLTKNSPTRNVLFKEPPTRNQSDHKEHAQTPTDNPKSIATVAGLSNLTDEERQSMIDKKIKDAMDLNNQRNMESMQSFNTPPDSEDSD